MSIISEEQRPIIQELDDICERLCEIDPEHELEHAEYISNVMQVYIKRA